jgi:hypothetical protein
MKNRKIYNRLYLYICKETKETPKKNIGRFKPPILFRMINDLLRKHNCKEISNEEIEYEINLK